MLPIKDENRSGITPFVTWALIAANVGVFIWQLSFGFCAGEIPDLCASEGPTRFILLNYGTIPAEILRGVALETVFTSMFLHGGFLHLFFNMLFLFIFGDNIEARFGRVRYLVAYLVFGALASYAHGYATLLFVGGMPTSCTPDNPLCVPAIGASGAVSGVLGAYAILYPRAKIVTLILLRFAFVSRIPAFLYVLFWFFFQQLLPGLFNPFGGVAIWAHIGGFVAGVLAAGISRLAGVSRRSSEYRG